MKRIKFIKTLAFLALVMIMTAGLQSLFYSDGEKPFHAIVGFIHEPKDSMDAVFIGTSNTHEFFQPPLAWKDHGINVYSLALPGMPCYALKYMLIEAHKYQPNALMILTLNGLDGDSYRGVANLHVEADFMPFSKNKVNMINDISERLGLDSFSERLEFYLPMIRFHSRWDDIPSEFYGRKTDGLMGASAEGNILTDSAGFQVSDFNNTKQRRELLDYQEEVLQGLVQTVEELQANVLFVLAPQFLEKENVERLNSAEAYLTERGYPVLNMFHQIGEIPLDLTADFYDHRHTNIHGSIKYTEYIMRYLKERYNFIDKRGDPRYFKWDQAAEKYLEKITGSVLDIELEHSKIDRSLQGVSYFSLQAEGTTVKGIWQPAPNADGVVIYRKSEGSSWERIAELTTETTFTDRGLEDKTVYTYAAVPFWNEGSGRVYGNWNYYGKSVETTMAEPNLTQIWKDADGITLTWEPVSDEKDYKIYRRESNSGWELVANEIKDLSFTDKNVKEGISYAYTVAAYKNDFEGHRDPDGVIFLDDDAIPRPVCVSENEKMWLDWQRSAFVSSYRITNLLSDRSEIIVKDSLRPTSKRYRAEFDGDYVVTALVEDALGVHECRSAVIHCGDL